MALRWGHHGNRLNGDDHAEIERRVAAGETYEAAALAIGCSIRSIQRSLTRNGGLKERARTRSSLRLSVAEREELSRGLLAGESMRDIARRLGRAPSTITREVGLNGRPTAYRGWRAEKSAARRAQRPKVPKLSANQRLRSVVEQHLRERWSPQQIAARLKRDYPGDPEMNADGATLSSRLAVKTSLHPIGKKVTPKQMRELKIEPHTFHGDWNYTIHPRPIAP